MEGPVQPLPRTGGAHGVLPEISQGLDALLAVQIPDVKGMDLQHTKGVVPGAAALEAICHSPFTAYRP